jgi:formate dehydrogenase iron-sulfur subunit
MPVYIDISRCIGCRSCEVACQRVHGGRGHINVHYVGDYASVPIFCHHCEDAFCTKACFTGALHKDGERTAFDVEKCTGCGLCRLACPFGVVWTDKIAHKCDLCDGREGGPACVITCPANALSTDFDLASRRARARAARAAALGGRR